MTTRMTRLCAVTIALALGCSGELDAPTQIQLTVDSDLDVPDQLDRVTIEVAGMVTDEAASADLLERGLPRRLTLVHEGGPLGPVRVTATGFLAGGQVVERVVETRFESGELVKLAIELQRACLAVTCPAGSSCADGDCRSIADGSPVGTPDGGEPERDAGEDGGARDAGEDGGRPDAGRDAGDSGSADNERPSCSIVEPLDSAAVTAGQSVRLTGRCDDPETGRIRAGFSWSSSIEGALCDRAMCDTAFATSGMQVIRLCAADPADPALQGCTSVRVNVSLPPPPTVSIDSVTQAGSSAQPFGTGPAIAFTASAEGQEVELVWRDTLVGQFAQGSAQATLTGPVVGRHVVTLIATDNVGQMRQASVTFVVLPQNASAQDDLIEAFATSNGVFAAAGGAAIEALASDSLDHAVLANPLPAVYRLNGQTPSTAAPALELTAGSGLPVTSTAVQAIAISEADDQIYIGTDDGLVVCDYAANTGVGGSCNTYRNGQFPDNDVRAVVRAQAEGTEYLVAGTAAGLFVSTNVSGSNNGRAALETHAIAGLAAADDMVWAATASDGLWSYELANDIAHAVDGGPSANLTAVVVDQRGGVWVGSDDGVGRYDPIQNSWLIVRTDASPEPHLIGDTIRCLAATRTLIAGTPHDVIWIGTDSGISRIDATLGTLMNLTEDDGLPSNGVRGITVLLDGSKLFGTTAGLARYAGP
jgi:hypothetical protein